MSSRTGVNSSSASAKGHGGDTASTNLARERRESKPERHPSKKSSHDEDSVGSSSRSSAAPKDHRDYARGELRSGAPHVERAPENIVREEKGKRRSAEKDTPAQDDSSTQNRMSVKRKSVPQLESMQTQEGPRPLFVDLEDRDGDENMSSSTSSIEEDDETMYDESRQRLPSGVSLLPGGLVPPPPPPPLPPLPPLPKQDQHDQRDLQRLIAQEEEEKAKMKEEQIQRLDYALAKDLDRELNDPPQTDAPAPNAADSAGPARARSTGMSFWSASPERQLEKYKEKYEKLKRENEEHVNQLHAYHQNYQISQSHCHRLFNQARHIEMECNAAKKHVAHLDNELKTVRHELSAVKQQLSDAVNLSEVRGKELKGAQVFLTKADTLSVTDVIQKVHALNEEIFQMAAFLGEVLVYETLEEGADRRQVRKAAVDKFYPEAFHLLGEWLATTLAQSSVDEPKEPSNPLLVQIVMQVALTSWCASMGIRWTSHQKPERGSTAAKGGEKQKDVTSSIRHQKQDDVLIRGLYDTIRENEDQAVAGRWRSLTRAHIPFSPQGWDHNLMVGILSIMGIAGWTTRNDEEQAQIEMRLASIFKPLLDLRKATGEDVTSADLEIAVVQCGTEFNPLHMEDAYADGRSSSTSKQTGPEPVISTSGLGLHKIVVKKLKGGAKQKQAEVLSMPKVVLEKTVKEALEPPPPTKRKKKTQGDGGGREGILGLF